MSHILFKVSILLGWFLIRISLSEKIIIVLAVDFNQSLSNQESSFHINKTVASPNGITSICETLFASKQCLPLLREFHTWVNRPTVKFTGQLIRPTIAEKLSWILNRITNTEDKADQTKSNDHSTVCHNSNKDSSQGTLGISWQEINPVCYRDSLRLRLALSHKFRLNEEDFVHNTRPFHHEPLIGVRFAKLFQLPLTYFKNFIELRIARWYLIVAYTRPIPAPHPIVSATTLDQAEEFLKQEAGLLFESEAEKLEAEKELFSFLLEGDHSTTAESDVRFQNGVDENSGMSNSDGDADAIQKTNNIDNMSLLDGKKPIPSLASLLKDTYTGVSTFLGSKIYTEAEIKQLFSYFMQWLGDRKSEVVRRRRRDIHLKLNQRYDGANLVDSVTSQRSGFWRHPAICFRDLSVWLSHRDDWVWGFGLKNNAHLTSHSKLHILAATRRCEAQYGQLFKLEGLVGRNALEGLLGRNSDTKSKEDTTRSSLATFYTCVPSSCSSDLVAREIGMFVIEYQLHRELFIDQKLLSGEYYGNVGGYEADIHDNSSKWTTEIQSISDEPITEIATDGTVTIGTTLRFLPETVEPVMPRIEKDFELVENAGVLYSRTAKESARDPQKPFEEGNAGIVRHYVTGEPENVVLKSQIATYLKDHVKFESMDDQIASMQYCSHMPVIIPYGEMHSISDATIDFYAATVGLTKTGLVRAIFYSLAEFEPGSFPQNESQNALSSTRDSGNTGILAKPPGYFVKTMIEMRMKDYRQSLKEELEGHYISKPFSHFEIESYVLGRLIPRRRLIMEECVSAVGALPSSLMDIIPYLLQDITLIRNLLNSNWNFLLQRVNERVRNEIERIENERKNSSLPLQGNNTTALAHNGVPTRFTQPPSREQDYPLGKGRDLSSMTHDLTLTGPHRYSIFLQKSLMRLNTSEYFGAGVCRDKFGKYITCYNDGFTFRKNSKDLTLFHPRIAKVPRMETEIAVSGTETDGTERRIETNDAYRKVREEINEKVIEKEKSPSDNVRKLRFGLGINVHLLGDLFRPTEHSKLERASSALQYGQKVSGVMSFWNQAGVRYLQGFGVEMYLLLTSPSRKEFESSPEEEYDDEHVPGSDIIFDREKLSLERENIRKKVYKNDKTEKVQHEKKRGINELSPDMMFTMSDERPTNKELVQMLQDPDYVDVLKSEKEIREEYNNETLQEWLLKYELRFYNPEQRLWVRNRVASEEDPVSNSTMYKDLFGEFYRKTPTKMHGFKAYAEQEKQDTQEQTKKRSQEEYELASVKWFMEQERKGLRYMQEKTEKEDGNNSLKTSHIQLNQYVIEKYGLTQQESLRDDSKSGDQGESLRDDGRSGKSYSDLKETYASTTCHFPTPSTGGELVYVPSHMRNLCLTPIYPLTRKQAELLKSWDINVIHYPLKRKMLKVMHKSHWRSRVANAWRYGLIAMLRFAFLELIELGGFDSFLIMELDMIIYNPFRVLHFMESITKGGSKQQKANTTPEASANPNSEKGVIAMQKDKSVGIMQNGKEIRTLETQLSQLLSSQSKEDVSQNHVFITNGDFHYIHEGLLIFSRIQSKSSHQNKSNHKSSGLRLSNLLTTDPTPSLKSYTIESIEKAYRNTVSTNTASTYTALEGLTQKDLTEKGNPSVFLLPEARNQLSVHRQFLLLLKYTPVTEISINNIKDTARTDMHHGFSYYEENGIGAGIFYYMFSLAEILTVKILDRCEWNYYLEQQFRQKFRSIGGDTVLAIDSFHTGKPFESAHAGIASDHKVQSVEGVQSVKGVTDRARSPMLKWYERYFKRAGFDMEFEQSKYTALTRIATLHPKKPDLSRKDPITMSNMMDETSRKQGLGVLKYEFEKSSYGGMGNHDGDINRREGSNSNDTQSEFDPFPYDSQSEWCPTASLRPNTDFDGATHAICLQWPIEIAEHAESRTDRCSLKGPPAIIHKLDRELLLYMDYLSEKQLACSHFGIN